MLWFGLQWQTEPAPLQTIPMLGDAPEQIKSQYL